MLLSRNAQGYRCLLLLGSGLESLKSLINYRYQEDMPAISARMAAPPGRRLDKGSAK